MIYFWLDLQGNAIGQSGLGLMYMFGKGVEKVTANHYIDNLHLSGSDLGIFLGFHNLFEKERGSISVI